MTTGEALAIARFTGLLPRLFTLSEAHDAVATVSRRPVDVSNFRRDARALIEATGKTYMGGRGRPAAEFELRPGFLGVRRHHHDL